MVGQYYNFLRLGREGYTQVMQALSQTARWLGEQLRTGEHCEIISDGSAIPVVSFRLARDRGYTEFDVSHELRGFGWQVPAYTMPDNATNVSVLRIVVREGLSADLARALHDDAVTALGRWTSSSPVGTTTLSTSRTDPTVLGECRQRTDHRWWEHDFVGRYADIPDAGRPRRGRGGPGCY